MKIVLILNKLENQTEPNTKYFVDTAEYFNVEYFNKFSSSEEIYNCFCMMMNKYFNKQFISQFIDIK